MLSDSVRQLYPWEGSFLNVSAGRMHYVDEGTGSPCLMVHGNPTWSFYYRRLIAELSKDHRCVVPDHIGCGLSDKPQSWTYRISDHVDNLCALIEELDLRDITLIVHDWGGAIGYAAALRHPDRFKRFVVMNTAAFLLPLPFALRTLRFPGYGRLVVQGLNGFLRMGMKLAVGHQERFQGAVKEGYFAPYQTWADRIAIRRFIEEIPIEKDHPSKALLRELEEGLPSLLDRPHVVFWGTKDPVFHAGYLKAWRERLPEAAFHEYEDCSHWVLEEASERIIPEVRAFLDRHPI